MNATNVLHNIISCEKDCIKQNCRPCSKHVLSFMKYHLIMHNMIQLPSMPWHQGHRLRTSWRQTHILHNSQHSSNTQGTLCCKADEEHLVDLLIWLSSHTTVHEISTCVLTFPTHSEQSSHKTLNASASVQQLDKCHTATQQLSSSCSDSVAKQSCQQHQCEQLTTLCRCIWHNTWKKVFVTERSQISRCA